jgi:hypothetical protein
MGSATVLIRVLALAPGYEVVTCTVVGVMGGYWAMGSWKTATAPSNRTTNAMTLESTGRSMKNSENMSRVTSAASACRNEPIPSLGYDSPSFGCTF